jgi:hypothetical protein
MKQSIKAFAAGFLISTLLTAGVAFAASRVQTIEITYRDIKLVVDGTAVAPKDATGKTVEPFIYDGTTYLPVRAVSEAVGKAVRWDNETSTVFLGAEPTTTPTPTPEPTPTATTGQRNALRSAETYLEIMAFSRSGLIKQLEFEGYSNEDATYAVDNVGADWLEQAARMAAGYLDLMPFSREGLIEQLIFEGFTREQAIYGVEANGY